MKTIFRSKNETLNIARNPQPQNPKSRSLAASACTNPISDVTWKYTFLVRRETHVSNLQFRKIVESKKTTKLFRSRGPMKYSKKGRQKA